MRVITPIISGLVLLLGISLASNKYVHDSSAGLVSELNSVEVMIKAGQWEGADKQLASMQRSWDKTKYGWAILLDHQEIDNIDISLSRLEEYVDTKGLTLSLGELSALKMLVDHIADNDTLTLRNIL